MTRPSSPGSHWVGLLQHVLDDDDRTRRADVLLSHLTTWLAFIVSAVIVLGLVLLNSPAWLSAGTGAAGVVAGIVAWWRRRRLAGGATAGAAEGSTGVVAVDEGGTEAAPAL